jgi:hypothetical protein
MSEVCGRQFMAGYDTSASAAMSVVAMLLGDSAEVTPMGVWLSSLTRATVDAPNGMCDLHKL